MKKLLLVTLLIIFSCATIHPVVKKKTIPLPLLILRCRVSLMQSRYLTSDEANTYCICAMNKVYRIIKKGKKVTEKMSVKIHNRCVVYTMRKHARSQDDMREAN